MMIQLLVLLKNGEIISMDALASRLGLRVDAVIGIVSWLEEQGYLIRKPAMNGRSGCAGCGASCSGCKPLFSNLEDKNALTAWELSSRGHGFLKKRFAGP
jgi:hypothetical protein